MKRTLLLLFFVMYASCVFPSEQVVNRFDVSKHALVRMYERGIAPQDVAKTLTRGTSEKIDGKIIYTLGRHWGTQKRCVQLVFNDGDSRVVTVMKKPEYKDEATAQKKKLMRRKMNHAVFGKSIIPHLYILEPTTPLEKNIARAIKENNHNMVQRLLALGAPYKSTDKLIARCFMAAVHLKQPEYARMLLQQATSFDQLSSISKDDTFRMLESDSHYPTVLRSYAIPLLKKKMIKELAPKRAHKQ